MFPLIFAAVVDGDSPAAEALPDAVTEVSVVGGVAAETFFALLWLARLVRLILRFNLFASKKSEGLSLSLPMQPLFKLLEAWKGTLLCVDLCSNESD